MGQNRGRNKGKNRGKDARWCWKGQTFCFSEEFVRYPPDHPLPRFGVLVHQPHPWQTDAQNAFCRRENEEEAQRLGIRLTLMQGAAEELGFARSCRIPRCRRLRRCAGRRDENDWDSFPLGPLAPPCLPDEAAVEAARLHTRLIVEAVLARNGQADESAPFEHGKTPAPGISPEPRWQADGDRAESTATVPEGAGGRRGGARRVRASKPSIRGF